MSQQQVDTVEQAEARVAREVEQATDQYERANPYIWGGDRAKTLTDVRQMVTAHLSDYLVEMDCAAVLRERDGAAWRVHVTVQLQRLESAEQVNQYGPGVTS